MSQEHFTIPSANDESVNNYILNLKKENADLAIRLERESAMRKILERKLSLNPKTGLPSHYRLHLDFDSIVEALGSGCPDRRLTVIIVRLGTIFSDLRKSLKSSVIEWILYQTGYRISLQRRETDLLYHTRDNEFIMIAPGLRDDALEEYINSLVMHVEEPQVFSGFNVTLPVSIGIAYYPEHGNDKSSVLQAADIAIETALESNIPVLTFQKSMIDSAIEKIELRNGIIKAIEAPSVESINRQFRIFFQPKLFLSAIHENYVQVERVEAEVLIRWMHPERGLLNPSKFLPLAEETGLILPIGKWLLYATADSQAEWRAKGLPLFPISINLSAKQFHSDDLVEILSKLVLDGTLDPSNTIFELTETSVFNELNKAQELMNSFKKLGFRISLDDFGTGYSSLSILQKLPIDEIKIDRSFTENVANSESDRVIIHAVIDMATKMGLSVIAEGIENAESLKEIFGMGCNGFQGYLFGKPMPIQDFEVFYRSVAESGGKVSLPSSKVS